MVNLILLVIGKLFPIIIGLYYLQILTRPYRLVLLHAAIVMLCEIAGYTMVHAHYRNNAWLFNIFSILPELWFMSYAGRELLKNGILKKVIPYFAIGGSLVWLINVIAYKFEKFAVWALLYTSLLLTLIYLAVLLNNIFERKKLLLTPEFWLSISVLLYFICVIPYFGLLYYMVATNIKLAASLAIINQILNYIRYPLAGLAIYMAARQQQQSNSDPQAVSYKERH